MTTDFSQYVVGDLWAYRARDDAASECVRIEEVIPGKRSARLVITFIYEPQRASENVPGNRLRVRWEDVQAFDASMADWQRLNDCELDEIEGICVGKVYDLLIPVEVAELDWSPVEHATAVRDLAALAAIVGLTNDEVLATGQWFDLDGTIMLSPEATLAVAEAACRRDPMRVLDWVIEQEAELRHNCKHGSQRLNPLTRETEKTSPEREYFLYLKLYRPRFELLRQWCGHRAVTYQERLVAAEAEVRRLDLLLAKVIDTLEHAGDKIMASHYSREHERDRIVPERARPIVDRPLDPSEIPMREVPRRRRWGY